MKTEKQLRLHRCCFTGHRPEKLSSSEQYIKRELEASIRQAIHDGFITFISGMARGVDIWAAEIVLKIKKEGYPIHLICAIPFQGFENSWDDTWKKSYRSIISQADLVRVICPTYQRDCFHRRNKWMVDRSARLIAVFNGTPGGTRNTINYAHDAGIDLVEIRTS